MASEQAPPTPFLLGPLSASRSLEPLGLPALELLEALHLVEDELEQLLAPNDLEMAPHLGILLSKPLHLVVRQVAAEAQVQLAREVVVELGQQLHVEEKHRRGRELGRHRVEEDLRAVVLVLEVGALLGLDGQEAHLDNVGAVAQEDGLATCFFASATDGFHF